MTDPFIVWLNWEISQAEALYRMAEGSRKKNINARILALRETRNKYLEMKEGPNG